MLDELQNAALVEQTPVPLDAARPVRIIPDIPVQPEATDLQIPKSVWHVMWACYALFFLGLLAAIGTELSGLFMLTISAAYTFMFFGTAAVLFGLNPPRKKSHFEHGIGVLETWTGPMSRSAVAGQILAVPLCIALFGISIAVIARAVGL